MSSAILDSKSVNKLTSISEIYVALGQIKEILSTIQIENDRIKEELGKYTDGFYN
jgi:hypothetical protein